MLTSNQTNAIRDILREHGRLARKTSPRCPTRAISSRPA